MTARLGVVILSSEVTAVLRRANRIVWKQSASTTESKPWNVLLDELLMTLPRTRLGRVRASVAFGPSFGAFRELHGLPQHVPPKELTRAIRLSPERYFAMTGLLAVTEVCSLGGKWWAGCIKADTLAMLTSTLRKRKVGISVITLLTASVAVSSPVVYSEILDGEDTISMARDSDSGEMVQRRMRRLDAETLHSALDQLAEAESLTRLHGAPAFPIDDQESWRQLIGHPLDFGFNALILLGFAVALFLPPWMTSRARVQMEAALASESARADDRQARAASPVALNVARWAAQRPLVMNHLARLSEGLPVGSTLLTFHQDSLGISIVALTTDAAALFRSVESLPGVGRATAIGPLTRERLGSRELSRVALHADFEAREQP